MSTVCYKHKIHTRRSLRCTGYKWSSIVPIYWTDTEMIRAFSLFENTVTSWTAQSLHCSQSRAINILSLIVVCSTFFNSTSVQHTCSLVVLLLHVYVAVTCNNSTLCLLCLYIPICTFYRLMTLLNIIFHLFFIVRLCACDSPIKGYLTCEKLTKY